MTHARSSCHPARLDRFGQTVDAVCDGLAHRAGKLDDALAAYRSSCEQGYRAPTVDTAAVVRGLISSLRSIGRWTGDVGHGFAQAALDRKRLHWPPDFEDVYTMADGMVLGYLSGWSDPYLGVRPGTAARLAHDLGEHYDQDDPPAWITVLARGGTVTDALTPLLTTTGASMAGIHRGATVTVRVQAGKVAVFGDGSYVASVTEAEMSARFLIPTARASELVTASRWVGRAGAAATFLSAGSNQWFADAGRPLDDRVGRATTRGGAVAAGSAAGAWAGGAIGGLCGPAAVVCSPVLGAGGGLLGAGFGNAAADRLPWMDEQQPGEHDLAVVRVAIGGDQSDIEPALEARADRKASQLAREATADDPVRHARVDALVPDDDALARAIKAGDWSAAASPSPGTTAGPTAAMITAQAPPDPWGGDHPWN